MLQGSPALHMAAANGHHVIVEMLLLRGADVNQKSSCVCGLASCCACT